MNKTTTTQTSGLEESLNTMVSKPLFVFLILFFVPFLTYLEVYTFQFSKDDFLSILPLPGLDQLSSIPRYFVSPVEFLDTATNELKNLHYYRPIATSTLTIDFFLFGKENPGILHLENLFLHILNGFLLFLLFSHLTTRQIALLGALCYSIFPMFTEMVSIYHYRVDLLCTFFMFLALYVTVTVEKKWWSYVVSMLFLLAMLSKEIAIVLLVLIPLLRYHRFSLPSVKEGVVIVLFPMLCYWSLRYYALGDFISPPNEFNLDIFQEKNVDFLLKMELILEAFGLRCFWILSPFQIQPKVMLSLTGTNYFAIPGLVLLLSLTISSLFYFKSKRLIHLASIGILTTWFPLSSILVAVPDFASARLFYYPAPWIILLLLLIVSSIPLKLVRVVIIASLLFLWGGSSYIQKSWYRSNLTGALGVAEFYPNNLMSQGSVGRILIQGGNYADGYEYSLKAYSLLMKKYGNIEQAAGANPRVTLDILKQLLEHALWREKEGKAKEILTEIQRLFPSEDILSYLKRVKAQRKE